MTILELDKINTKYGDSQVLHDISMTIEENESVALLGRNGAGKSTTSKSIMGIQPPFKGTMNYQDEPITNSETFEIAPKRIKYIPEDRRVFENLTVNEHLTMGVDRDHRSQEAEFERTFDIFPQLKELRDRKAEFLSGGEQQMLVIARALIGPTELLLLDEPSEGLAPQIVETIFHTINRLKYRMTVFLVEQNFAFARAVCDRYYLLDQGHVVSEGSMEELAENQELKSEYLGVV